MGIAVVIVGLVFGLFCYLLGFIRGRRNKDNDPPANSSTRQPNWFGG